MRSMKDYNQLGVELFWKDGINWMFKARMKATIKMIDEPHRFFNLLDVGCGIGIYTKEVHKRYPDCNIRGFDISEKQINYINDDNFFVDDATTFNFKATFDVILCTEVLEHIHNPESVLKRIRKHCHKDTQVVVSVPLKKDSCDQWSETFYKYIGKEVYEFFHKKYFEKEIKNLLVDNGFVIDKIKVVKGIGYSNIILGCKIN